VARQTSVANPYSKNLTDKQWLALMKIVDSDEIQGVIMYPKEPGADAKVLRASGPSYVITAAGVTSEF
jgi:hypothetical protein